MGNFVLGIEKRKLVKDLGLSFGCSKASDQEILNYCQDLSVLHHRIKIITENMANNVDTTKTLEGGHYKRQDIKEFIKGVCIISKSQYSILKYEPSHDDANKNG